MLTVWRKNVLYPLVFFLVFAAIEATFLSSSVLKIPKGGWFSLMLAGIYGAPLHSLGCRTPPRVQCQGLGLGLDRITVWCVERSYRDPWCVPRV